MIEGLPGGLANGLWIGLILIGFSLFFTGYYFRHQSKKLNRTLSQLYDLNLSCEQDALDFFEQSWPILNNVGCTKIQASIDWFGEQKHISNGQDGFPKNFKQVHCVVLDDMRFELIVYVSREASQQDSIASLVIKTFLNILEQNLVLKQSEILTSQKRLERYQLFVQHEIKNIAQFIQLLSEQLQSVDKDQEKIKLVERLATTIPMMAKRARKTVDHMQQPLSEFYEVNTIVLGDVINEVVQMYGLEVTLYGEVEINFPRKVLLEVFKNVLGNFRDHPSSNKTIKVYLNQDETEQRIKVLIQSQGIEGKVLNSERMFEPFWTTSESGMGLGLFLSRELLKQLDGSIRFYQDIKSDKFGFEITLPGLAE